MSAFTSSMTAGVIRGRTIFICALFLLAVMLFEPILTPLFSGKRGITDSIGTIIIYFIVLIAAFRGGFVSLTIIKGCLGIFAAILGFAAILIGIESSRGLWPPPRIGWDMPTLLDIVKAIPLFYVYWALFFSKSVKEFITYQREYFHALEMKKIKEDIGRTGPCS